MHLIFKLKMFGSPLEYGKFTNVFYENESVGKNSTIMVLLLNKKHSSIAYHHVIWMVLSEVISVVCIPGKYHLYYLFTKI